MPGPDRDGRLADAAGAVDEHTPRPRLRGDRVGDGGQFLFAAEEEGLVRKRRRVRGRQGGSKRIGNDMPRRSITHHAPLLSWAALDRETFASVVPSRRMARRAQGSR
jgi:hypothetical protein